MSCAVRVSAYAKINLSLRVLGVRPDGNHDLRTIFQSIALHDTLTVRARRGPFALECDDPACPADETNLVWRAAEQVWAASGRRGTLRDVEIRLAKRIPLKSGLGGGSSDAAAALRALGSLWRVKDAPLREIAVRLGADVPYFLEGGTVLGLDRGDLLFPLVDHPVAWVTVVVPSFGVSTVDATDRHVTVVLASGDAVVSIVGYALVGAGLAPVVPILFNAATRVPGTSRAAAIAAVSSIGYAGFLIGPPLIGGLAQAVSLTAAMWVVVLASALLAIGARKVG